MKKYLTDEYALNLFGIDWHPDYLKVKNFQETNITFLKDVFVIPYQDEFNEEEAFFVAKPSRAFVDLFLQNKLLENNDLIKSIEREFELTSEITSEMLEMLYTLYQHSSKDKKILTFEKNNNNFEEFKNQLGFTFNKFYSPEIITFEKSLNN